MLAIGSQLDILAITAFLIDIHGGDVIFCIIGIVAEITLGHIDGCLISFLYSFRGKDLCFGAQGGDAHQGCKY